jgi:hypothetical protein
MWAAGWMPPCPLFLGRLICRCCACLPLRRVCGGRLAWGAGTKMRRRAPRTSSRRASALPWWPRGQRGSSPSPMHDRAPFQVLLGVPATTQLAPIARLARGCLTVGTSLPGGIAGMNRIHSVLFGTHIMGQLEPIRQPSIVSHSSEPLFFWGGGAALSGVGGGIILFLCPALQEVRDICAITDFGVNAVPTLEWRLPFAGLAWHRTIVGLAAHCGIGLVLLNWLWLLARLPSREGSAFLFLLFIFKIKMKAFFVGQVSNRV